MILEDYTQIKSLVFAGGGIRGIAYLGSLLAQRDKQGIDWTQQGRVKTFAGTSVGSLIALMLVCGFSLDDLQTFVKGIRFESLTESYFLHDLVSKVLDAKGFSQDISMEALALQTGKHLIVAVTDLASAGIQQISAKTQGQYSVREAVIGSMSLPFVFEPVKQKNHVWLDGGLIDYFPIHLCPPSETLGFQVQQQIDADVNLSTTKGFLSRLISTVALTQERLLDSVCLAEKYFVVRVDVGPMSAVQDVSPQEIESMIFKAYRDVTTGNHALECPLKYFPKECQTIMPVYLSNVLKKFSS